mmetsp:Transcript_321/g.862  ORF Transcript_321/g.862 Transcript_321/m.862 type:complete len:371 (-) Transcript_321:1657-2769(-)
MCHVALSGGDLNDGLGKPLDVLRGDSGHGDTPVPRHVDALFINSVDLLGGHAGEAEHTDLVGHVLPLVPGDLLEVLPQGGPHADDAVGHALDLVVPQSLEGWVAQHGRDEESPVEGRVGVGGPGDPLHLALDGGLLLLAVASQAEASDPLAVQSHVLGVGLGAAHHVTVLEENIDGLGVLHAVTGGEALVRHVEEWEVALLPHQLADLLPLVRGWVHARWVVGASVEQEEAAPLRGSDVLHHAIEVESPGLRLVVPEGLLLDAGVTPDVVVVGPRRNGDVNLRAGLELLHEVRHEAARPGSGKTLHGSDLVGLDQRVVIPVSQLDRVVAELLEAAHRQVLHELVSHDLLLRFADTLEDHRVAIVVTVSSL